jgi:catechol 1,2-dioxygenase
MKRREFIATTALTAVAVSASGFIRFDGKTFEGDCETTTDILGPFYRPDSPVRNNLRIPGDSGALVELSGTIKHNDCTTPYNNAKIELWHCDGKGVYDNTSDKFRYRGTTYCNEKGEYSFKTILPIPYDAGGGDFRPAHFHLMITAEGYLPLVTQLYFTGDQYIAKDLSSSSPSAKRRILEVQTLKDETKKVLYNVSMSETLIVEHAVLTKLTGVYINEKDKKDKKEFFVKNKLLWTKWTKTEQFGMNLDYVGNNTFRLPGLHDGMSYDFHFELLSSASVKLTTTFTNAKGEKDMSIAIKEV